MTDFTPIDLNLRECFRTLASIRSIGETRQIGDIEILSLGVRFQMFNAAFLSAPVVDDADLERRIAVAKVQFAARRLEWSFWLCDGFLPEKVKSKASRIFGRQGLNLVTQMPGMIATELQAPARPMPEFEVRAANVGVCLNDFRKIGARCFQVPLEWFSEVFDVRMCERASFRAWVGYANGRPVATAATVTATGAIGVYNVATLPEYRSRGFGEHILRKCVAFAADGSAPLPIVLQSTALGLRLYQRMGFESVTRFRVWTP